MTATETASGDPSPRSGLVWARLAVTYDGTSLYAQAISDLIRYSTPGVDVNYLSGPQIRDLSLAFNYGIQTANSLVENNRAARRLTIVVYLPGAIITNAALGEAQDVVARSAAPRDDRNDINGPLPPVEVDRQK